MMNLVSLEKWQLSRIGYPVSGYVGKEEGTGEGAEEGT